jgi:hypothetical protein
MFSDKTINYNYPLQLEHVFGAIPVLLIGILLSLVAFAIEMRKIAVEPPVFKFLL